jgi:hypothetical protein
MSAQGHMTFPPRRLQFLLRARADASTPGYAPHLPHSPLAHRTSPRPCPPPRRARARRRHIPSTRWSHNFSTAAFMRRGQKATLKSLALFRTTIVLVHETHGLFRPAFRPRPSSPGESPSSPALSLHEARPAPPPWQHKRQRAKPPEVPHTARRVEVAPRLPTQAPGSPVSRQGHLSRALALPPLDVLGAALTDAVPAPRDMGRAMQAPYPKKPTLPHAHHATTATSSADSRPPRSRKQSGICLDRPHGHDAGRLLKATLS